MVTIIDYKIGNLGSIVNMLNKLGVDSQVTSSKDHIQNAQKLILPGVGAFDNGMQNLNDLDLINVLNKKVIEEKTPILGICLGTQLFTSKSEEGVLPGLGWFNAETVKFDSTLLSSKHKIPHMGWAFIKENKNSKLFEKMFDKNKFYFVHSYHLKVNDSNDCLASAHFGYDFCAALEKDNIVGVQFHPEKSHKFGMQLLKNFVQNY